MDVSEFLRSNLAVSIISLFAGALITALATKLHGRTKKLRYSTRTERLALAADDPLFGSVRVSWGDRPVRNLYMASVEIENASAHDFESVDLKIYTGDETVLLSERTAVVGTPYVVDWSHSFRAALAVAPGAAPTAEQLARYVHSRDYHVEVFNRGQLLRFNYLCTRPTDDAQPEVFVSTQLKGAKLKYQVRSNLMLGVPLQIAAARGLILAMVVVLLCGLYLRSVWAASGVSMLVGLFAQLLGCIEYKGERWLRNLIAG